MRRNAAIILVFAAVIALPFVFRQKPAAADWRPGDPVLVIISPHNEAIRYEFGEAFSRWYREQYGRPVKVDWRTIGGTSEIMRYLEAEMVASFRAWWIARGEAWPAGGGDLVLDRRFDVTAPPPPGLTQAESSRWETKRRMHQALRRLDDADAFTCRIDLFFGGGAYDHGKADAEGLTVPPWPAASPPPDLLNTADGTVLIPEGRSGETWRTDTFFGTCLSTFGICYNPDRIAELGIANPPSQWRDLASTDYAHQLGVADPTKSGSIAKAFEMIIHQSCHEAVARAGFTPDQVDTFEVQIGNGEEVPHAYRAAVENGWLDGLRRVQLIGSNARYFTDAAGKVPIDVSTGNAAAGLAIDFYGRYQGEISRGPDGAPRLVYVTPRGGSSVSADPISLLRGAEHRELAVQFIRFVLSEDGQKLWNYAPGTPGGPVKFALRRMPIRRDFYPSDNPAIQAQYERHSPYTVDTLGDPTIDPYRLAGQFEYHPRWTARHFNVHRDLIRCMCLDAGEELRAAWDAIIRNGGPDAQPEALHALQRMPDRPEPVSWESVLTIHTRFPRLEYMREWTIFFRKSYREAKRLAEGDA